MFVRGYFISVFTFANALAFTLHLKCTLSSEFNECDILTQSFTCSLISEKVAAFRTWMNSHVMFCHGRCVFQEWCKSAVPDCNPHKPQTRRFGGERKYSRRVSTSKKKCKWGPRRSNHIAWGDANSWWVHQHYWLNYRWINKRPERATDAE